MIGQTISHYRITEKLGEGGMGVVYKAEDTKLKRPVALKFLAPHLLRDEEGRKRFLREAQAAAALDHPNVCTVYEIDEADDRTFITMAFLEGRTLSKRIADGPLKLPEALLIATQMAEGLEAAHEKGVVHRDIKPDNVMLMKGSRGLVKLMDFGLAQLAESSKLTREGTTLGTPIYMSPEQALGEPTDSRSDVWALGVVLYEMVAGQPPFRGEVDQAVIYAIANEQHEPLTAVRTGVPKELERIADKCLAKEAHERYQHVTDLLVDLQAVRRGLESQTQKALTGRAQAKSLTPGVIGLAAVVLLAVASLAWWLNRSTPSTLETPQYKFSQLTRDAGLTFQPTISPDGKLIAYASDRAGKDNLDIWVQQVSGGEPVQRTFDEADDYEPSFSPDSSQLVFQSGRQGGGIFIGSALGGQEKLLARVRGSIGAGAKARFSPDGQWVAYSVGGVSRESRIYLVPATGGTPRPLEIDIPWAFGPVWSPDSSHLLFLGATTPRLVNREQADWYVAPVDGGIASKTGALDQFAAAGISRVDVAVSGTYGVAVRPEEWLENPQRIVFAALSGDTVNIYHAPLSVGTWRLSDPRRLTTGTREVESSVIPNGLLAFSDRSGKADIWFLPMNANTGKVLGERRLVVRSGADEQNPTVSAHGTTLAFHSRRSGDSEVWLKDLESGTENSLAAAAVNSLRVLISPDGTKVAFGRGPYGNAELYIIPTRGGLDQEVTDRVATITCWSSDSKRILYLQAEEDPQSFRFQWSAIDVETRVVQDVVRSSKYPIHAVKYSPDDRWISFLQLPEAGVRETWVAPLRAGVAADESEWIQITESQTDGRSWWSPDGNLLYYLSGRDGFYCIWARRLDPSTKHPLGEQIEVKHFHDMASSVGGGFGYGLAPDGLYFGAVESTGNIWLAEPVQD